VSICLVDTSILCEILRIPNKCENHRQIYAQMQRKVKTESLLLPMSVIIETGNHVGQNGDGRQRRKAARDFVELIQKAIRGMLPFTPTPPLYSEQESLLEWLREFPDWAGRGSGLGDLTILKEFERQCFLNPGQRVYIWSTDEHLSSYDRPPEI
jgi:hypothetical protein